MPNNFDKLFNQQQGNDLINALKGIKSSLDVNYPLETVNVTLSNNAQNITPSENYYGLGQVNVPGMNLSDMTILVNGNYDPVTSGLDGYGKLNVNVPTWGQADEGKVVSNNALVPQTNREVNANGTYDTTLNNSVLVNVPNTYGSEDEGKVVMNNALVPQTNRSITQNGTYDTTTNDEVVVDVQGGGDAKIYRFIDETYYMDETGLICELSNRQYTKTYSDPAFVAYVYYSTNYTAPLLVSKTVNGATYTAQGGGDFSPTQETIDGETWYVSQGGYAMSGNETSTDGYATKLTGSYATPKLAAEALLQLAYDDTVTENGSYTVPEGYDGFGDFNVDVEADTETLSVTQNGTYTPSTGKDGFSQVTVNVQGGGGSVLVETPVYARVIADSEFTSTVSGMGRPSAANAMGSDTYSWWGANSNGQHYLLITMPEAIAIKQVKFSNYWSDGSSTWHSSRVVLEGSNDNTTWDNLLDETDLPQSDTQNEYLLQNTTAYLYYKFTCYSTLQYYTGLGKVQLFYEISGGGSGGSKNILGGTTAPTSADGTDGDIYIKYTDYSGEVFPSGYTPIEYIESSSNGGQYIDTNYSPNADSEIYFRGFIYTSGNSGNRAVWGTTSPSHWIISHINGSPNLTYAWGGTDSRLGGDITGQIVKVTAKKGDVTVLADNGTLIQHHTPSAGNNTGSGKILIFRGEGTNSSTYLRLYRFEVHENDTAIRIMQPAKRNSDNALGMYDLVNDVFYTNSGTGTFIGGEELTGTPIDTVYLKVDGDWIILEDGDWSDVNTGGGSTDDWTSLKDYIESSGTQWIDTNYIPNENSQFELVANISAVNNVPCAYGVRELASGSANSLGVFLFPRYSNSNNLYYSWGTNETSLEASTPYLNKKSVWKIKKTKVYVESQDEDIKAKSFNGGTVTSQYSLYIFSLNQGGSEYGAITRCTMKLYRFRIYESDVLVHEYVPWTDTNDVVCLKDTVTGDLLYNAGTGNFVRGEDE